MSVCTREAVETWMLQSHSQIVNAARDPDRFSSAVSRFLQIPNGLDGDEHRRFRALIEPFMTDERVQQLEPRIRSIADELVARQLTARSTDAVWDLGARFAVRAQITWLSWSPELEPELLQWMHDHRAANIAADDELRAAAASRFDGFARSELDRRRQRACVLDDVTSELLHTTHDGAPLDDAQLVSILRNWTAGDLGTLASSFGVIAHRLATDDALQDQMRTAQDPRHMDHAIDELLRIDDPFLTSRRVTTCPVELDDGRVLRAGSRVTLSWASANRDPTVFAEPDAFDPCTNAQQNLVYGIGPHACPGRALATMELRALTSALLGATTRITLDPDRRPERNGPGLGGYRSVWIEVERG